MSFVVDQTPATGAAALFNLLTAALTPVGGPSFAWTVPTSGSGTGGVYAQLGNVISSASVLTNAAAWFVLQLPAYQVSPYNASASLYRQLCFQRGADNASWRVKYSARAKFVQGTPAPGQTPSAADEQVLLGGGTDGAPTYGTLFPADGTYRQQACVLEGQSGFWMVTYPQGNPTPNGCFLMDPLAVGSYATDDAGYSLEQDPVVLYLRTGGDTLAAASLASESTGPRGWLKYGAVGASFVRLPAPFLAVYDAAVAVQVAAPGGLPQNAVGGGFDDFLPTYVRRAALGGTTSKKGDATLWRWSGTAGLASGRVLDGVDAQGNVTSSAWVVFRDVLLRWDQQTPAVVDG